MLLSLILSRRAARGFPLTDNIRAVLESDKELFAKVEEQVRANGNLEAMEMTEAEKSESIDDDIDDDMFDVKLDD